MPRRCFFAIFIVILSAWSAQRACCSQFILGDLNSDYRVNEFDLLVFAGQWLQEGGCSGAGCADFDDVNGVNFSDFAIFAKNWRMRADGLVINEFGASNKNTLFDGNRESSDWIELYNCSEMTISLCGWYLTDDMNNPAKWPLPCSVTVEGGGYLIIFASGKDVNDYLDSLNYWHTNFKLDAEGEYLALIRPDGVIANEYKEADLGGGQYGFPEQLEDISYGIDFNEISLVSENSTALINFPSDDSAGRLWIYPEFQTDSNWFECINGIGFNPDQIEQAGNLLVDLRAKDLQPGALTQWNNHGTLGGYFYDDGTDLWTAMSGYVTSAGFDGSNRMRSNFTAPAAITGNSDWSIEAWVYNQQIGGIEAVVQWGSYLGTADGTSCVLSYGSSGSAGAMLHIGPGDIGYDGGVPAANNWHHIAATYQGGANGVESIYVDGRLNASEQKSLNISARQIFRLGNANGNFYYTGALAAVRVHDGVLTAQQITDNYASESGYYYVIPPPYIKSIGSFIRTDIESIMKGVNSSLYTRYEFDIEDANTLRDNLVLKVYYDDGFIAYLNGVEVARRNCPGQPQWNSAATAERTEQMAATVELIDISGFRNLLAGGKNVLAIQAMNWTVDDGEFLIMPLLINLDLDMDKSRHLYFYKPTPWFANDSAFANAVEEVRFSVERGFYDQPFQVRLATDTKGAQIRYTVDGSSPTASSGYVYDANNPIQVSTTTCLRAAAFKQGYISSPVMTHTYIFLDDVINQPASAPGPQWPPPGSWYEQRIDYEMDPDVTTNPEYAGLMDDALLSIPTLCFSTDLSNLFDPVKGIYVHCGGYSGERGIEWERPVSVELINPDGSEGFYINAGLRMRGITSCSGSNPKHAFRLMFRSQYGESKLNFPLFGDEGTDSFDNIDIRCEANYSWNNDGLPSATYIREVFSRDLQREMNQPYTRSRYYHLYINGVYWGLYQTQERTKASYGETYFGEEKEDYDAVKTDQSWPRKIEATDGSLAAYERLFNAAMAGFVSNETYYKVQGLNTDGTPNPNYEKLVDVLNLIDYMLTVYYTGDFDGPISAWCGDVCPNNYWGLYNRVSPDGFKFFRHDAEHSLGVQDDLYRDRTGPFNYSAFTLFENFNPQTLHEKLILNPEYKQLFADHIYRHFFNNGIITPQKAQELFLSRAAEIDLAIIAESARWGDAQVSWPHTKNGSWLPEISYVIDTYMPQRTDIVLNQLRNQGWYPDVQAPSFYINGSYKYGGDINSGDNLSMTAPAGTIYYTFDGSDPRLPGGSVNPSASIYSGSQSQTVTLISENASKKVFVPTSDIGTTWHGGNEPYNDSAWTHGTPIIPGKTGGVGFDNDTPYLPYISYDVKSLMYNIMASCYVRIPFNLTAEQLSSMTSLTLKVRCDDGFAAFLNGGVEVASLNKPSPLVWNSATTGSRESTSFVTFDITSKINQLREGTNILAIHAFNRLVSNADFLVSPVLEATIPSDSLELSKSTYVKSRALSSGQWSPLSEAYFAVGSIAQNLRITEIMYHPQEWPLVDPNAEFIELRNIGSQTINLKWSRFTEGIHFTFPDIALSAGQYIVVVRNINAFQTVYGTGIDIAGSYSGGLDNAGERIRLEDCLGRTIHDFEYKDGWRDVTDGGGFSLMINNEYNPDINSWADKDSWSASTLAGGSPASSDSGPRHGDIVINEVLAHSHGAAADWIELYNTTDNPIDIGGWFLSDDDSNLPKYQIAADTNIPAYGCRVFYEDINFGPLSSDPGVHYPFSLSENGDQVCLSSGSAGQLTGCRIQETFGASQTDVSFGRYYKSSTDSFNFVSMSQQTAGSENAYPMVGPIIISEIMYHPERFWGNWDAEYIELFNITAGTVNLFDIDGVPWKFTEGIDFTFPPNTSIPPYGVVLLVKDMNAFASEFTVPGQVNIFVWQDSRLDNGGETIELSMPGDYDENGELQYIRIERVNYSDGSHPQDFNGIIDPWPLEADGMGESLTRINLSLYGNDPNNWSADTPTPGVVPSGYEWTLLTYDDFESGWGNYTPGGEDCLLYTAGSYAHSGSNAADIQDIYSQASSFYHTDGIDVQTPAYTQIKVDFWYYPVSMETAESFRVEYFDGTAWNQAANFVSGTDFVNNQFFNAVVYINEGTAPGQYNFPVNMKIKFVCNATGNTDDVYIDDIIIRAK